MLVVVLPLTDLLEAFRARAYMDTGDYVPDRVTNEMVRDRLSQNDAQNGWLLDRYPRTPAQVDELDGLCRGSGQALDLALVLHVAEEELVRRLVERASSEGRSDDTEAVIRHRQQVFREQTEALTSIYEDRGILRVVDGRGAVSDVTDRCLVAVAPWQGRKDQSKDPTSVATAR